MRTRNPIGHMFWRAASASILLAASLAVNTGSGTAASSNCTSERTESSVYTGNNQAGLTNTNQKNWNTGVLAITPQPGADIVVGFKMPNEQNWHDSKPVSSKPAARILLKLGPGDVQFSTQYHASAGSAACNNPPATTFSPSPQAVNDIKANTVQPTWPASSAKTGTPSPNNTNNPSTNSNPGNGGSNGGGGPSY